MNRLYLIISLLLLSTSLTLPVRAQENTITLWADKVIEVSSSYKQGILFKEDLRYNKYPAKRVTGHPDVLPGNFGDSPNAWVPQRADREEFIKVGFEYPIKIQQIAIAESRNPGAVSEIYTYDLAGNERLVAELEAAPVNTEGRLYNVFIDPTDYEVYAIKLVLDGAKVPGYNAIDGIAISSSPIPVNADIDIADGINPELSAEVLDFNPDETYISLKPIMAPDGNMLFFSRRSPRNVGGEADPEDIWYINKIANTNAWTSPKNIGRPLNNRGSNFVSAVNMDENDKYVLLLGNTYHEDNRMTSGVSTSRQMEGGWSKPMPLNIENFYNYAMTASYYLSNDERYLLMAVERDDSYGEQDLYISFKQGSNSWSEPVNLGAQINTPDIESSPYIASDDSTLYFSSRGYSGFGGEDVYVSYRLDDSWQKWSEPKNLGPAINSSRDDTFFNIGSNEEYAYFTRGKVDQADLYQVSMPIFSTPVVPPNMYIVRGQVYNVRNNMPVDAEIVAQAVGQTAEALQGESTADGTFAINLPPGQYQMQVKKDGFAQVDQQTFNLEQMDEDGDRIINTDLYLIDDFSKVDIKEQLLSNKVAIAAEEILFDLNKAALDKRAYSQLQRVADFLKENQSVNLKIEGHTCNRGTSQHNLNLSQRRAQSVADYLKKQGISPIRLEVRGYGERDPLVSNTSESNRRVNRRVEFSVIE